MPHQTHSPIKTYDVGDTTRLSVEITDAAGDFTDPTTVTLRVKAPDGTITTLAYPADAAVVRESTGQFHSDVVLNAAGRWYYRWEAGGDIQGAGEWELHVLESAF